MEITSYEQAANDLDNIVDRLQKDEISIDELAPQLKRATELFKYCKEKLRTTEAEVRKVLEELNKD